MIHLRSNGMKIQLPRLQPREVDEEAPWNSSLDNARSSSLPPSSSPPQIFSSSPFASSQSSLIEIGDHGKVADRVYAPCFLCVFANMSQVISMEPNDQDIISSLDGVYSDSLEEAYNYRDDTDAYQQREMVRDVFFGSLITINWMDHSTSPATSPFTKEAPKRTRPLMTSRKLIHCRRSDPGRKER